MRRFTPAISRLLAPSRTNACVIITTSEIESTDVPDQSADMGTYSVRVTLRP